MTNPQDIGDYVLWVMWSIGCLLLGASFKTVFRDGVIKYYQAKIASLRAVIYDMKEAEIKGHNEFVEYHGAEHQEKR